MLFLVALSCAALSCAPAGPPRPWAQVSTVGLREVEHLTLLTQLFAMGQKSLPIRPSTRAQGASVVRPQHCRGTHQCVKEFTTPDSFASCPNNYVFKHYINLHNLQNFQCKLPAVEECMQLAEASWAGGHVLETVKYYLLSQEPEKALPVGLDFIKEHIKSSEWTLDTILPVLDLLSYIRTEKLLQPTCAKARNELLVLCGYVGALLAIRRRYESIVPALYEYTSQLLKRREVSVPLTIECLSEELDAWRACVQSANPSSGASPYTPPSESQRTVYAALRKRLQEEPCRGLAGPGHVTGSHLPSHSDGHVSCLTGLKIQGPVCLLEDGKSAISLNDALMWAKVNPFSPLGTGVRLNPF